MNFKNYFAAVTTGMLLFGLSATNIFAVPTVVYEALPSLIPDTSYPSQPFQAQQTSEFGDFIHLAGTERVLDSVTVTMVTWAKFADYATNSLYMGNSSYWTHPVTLNIYDSHLGVNGAPDTKLATVTKTVIVPWRPAADPSCPNLMWRDLMDQCNNGYAFFETFNMQDLKVTLPDDIIVSVAFNTQSYGGTPIGIDGPYNSLNIAVPENLRVTVGADDNTGEVFWNTATKELYSDAGLAGFGILRKDTNWAPYGTVSLRVVTDTPTIVVEPPTDIEQCKKDGWRKYNNPEFKNQGACVSHVEEKEKDKIDHDRKERDKEDHQKKDKERNNQGGKRR